MRRTLLMLIGWCCVLDAGAQASSKGRISITITNEQQGPLENATVELLRSKDSALVKVAITDKSGIAEFENLNAGGYRLRATHGQL